MFFAYARSSTLGSSDDTPTSIYHRIETDLVPLTTGGSKIIIPAAVLVLLTSLWTFLRFWCLQRSGRAFMLEDGFHIGAVVLFYALIATDFTLVLAGGMGHHVKELQDWHLVRLMKTVYACQFFYATSLGLIKISVVLMLMRIFRGRRFRAAALAAITFTIVWMLLVMLINLFICRPMDGDWHPRVPMDICGNYKTAFSMVGVVDIINQLIILVLPLPVIWRLEMEYRYKMLTMGILSIGILTLVFGAIHLSTVIQIDFADVPYTAVEAVIYGTCETGVAVIVSSCPLLRPLFDMVLPINSLKSSSWQDRSIISVMTKTRKSTKSSGFTQMKNESQEELELGNMGAHRARRDTYITASKRPSFREEDGHSVRKIVVTSETIVSRDKGEL